MRKKLSWLLAGSICWIVAAGPVAAQEIPDEQRQQLVNALGGPFVIIRDTAMDELKITDEQREQLSTQVFEQIMETGPFLDSLEGEKQADREKKLAEHRQEAHKKLAAFLKETLKPEQLKRFRQINLRYEGLFGLAEADRTEVLQELKLDAEQQGKLTALVKKLPGLIQKAVLTAKLPDDEAPKIVRKIRRAQDEKMKALLNEAQDKQWQEILGQPFEVDF